MAYTKGQKVRRGCLGMLGFFSVMMVGFILLGVAAVNAVLEHCAKDLPKASSLYYFEPAQTTRIFAANGELIATLYRENRTWVKLENMSPNLKKAVLAIEDSRFYEHRGVDPVGIARALVESYRSGDKQGASTITMQLARNVFLNAKQTYDRKLKEMLLAIKIEQTFTKDEILEMYLNQIYLGSGTYGVQAASNLYFNKTAKNLSVAEAALLAGLPQSPTQYSPHVDEKAARARQRVVLERMKDCGFLDQAGLEKAIQAANRMKFHNKNRDEFQVLKVPYFTTYVIKQLYKRFDEDTLYRGGLRVYTTVDLKLQQKAEKIIAEKVKADSEYLNVHQGGAVVIENKTGYIRAMVGGAGPWTKKNQFNRAWQARRQPGSSFKPFVYATALECGLSPESVVPDSPITIDGWTPKNSDGRFMGAIPLSTALQNSRNVVSVRLAQITGVKRIMYYARQMGITETLPEVISLSLGSCEIPPLEMAAAYTCFPNAGLKVEASPIKLIKDAEGRVVEDNRVPKQKEVLAESTACGMVDMMRRVVESGTATNAYIERHEVAGKTGTTDSFRDAWFCGYTRDLTTAVWIGNDDFSRMWTSFGGDLPARMWHDIMVFALRGVKESTIPRNRYGKQACLFCAESNMRAGPSCPKVYRKLMRRFEIPYNYCSTHGAPQVTYSGLAPHSDAAPVVHQNHSAAPPPRVRDQGGDSAPIPQQVILPGEVPSEVPVVAPGEAVPAPPPAGPEPAPVEPEPVPMEVPVSLPPAPEPVVIPPPAPAPAPPPAP